MNDMSPQPKTDDLRIRIATPDDMDEMMVLAMAGCHENGFLNPSPVRLAEEMWPALCQHNGIVGAIGLPGGIIEGAVLIRIGMMWYSDQDTVEERAIFIHPDYRSAKGGRARRLCEFSKSVADSLGMPLVIGVLSNHRTAGKIRMYQRVFGEQAGAFFLYNARTGSYADEVKT